MGDWGDLGVWEGDGLRREAFFFDAGGTDLFGSVYAPPSPLPPAGALFCAPWGIEGDQATRLLHPVALSVAHAGGAVGLFHYPGYGDSRGDPSQVTMDGLADSAVAALDEFSRRHPGVRWLLAGFMLGASIACLATARGAPADRLLLVQPELRPGRYLARLERASRRTVRLAPSDFPPQEGFAYGYPLPRAMLDSGGPADGAVQQAVSRFRGDGAVVAHAVPAEIEGVPERFEQVRFEGAWRFGAKVSPPLIDATAQWLRAAVAEGVAG